MLLVRSKHVIPELQMGEEFKFSVKAYVVTELLVFLKK